MNKIDDRSCIYAIELNNKQTNDARIIASKFISDGTKVLDVGCACGDFGLFISNEKNCQVFGMEYDVDSIVEAEKKNVFNQIHQVDLNTFQTDRYSEYYGFFDYITLIDVLEHTMYPEQSLLKLKPYIKNNGYFIISLPNISFGDIKLSLLEDDFTYTDMGILDKTHLRFFTYKTIASFCSNLGLEIIDCKAKIADITYCNQNIIPSGVKRFINNDPHSFVYQYILKAQSTSLSQELLIKNNNNKVDLKWSDINIELKKIKKNKLINILFPIDSTHRGLVKFIYNSLKKKFNNAP